jgi:hypothetical protein
MARVLTVPDVAGMDTLSAALAYAKAGWYVGPVKRGTKDPGSVLGKDWQHKTSRDPKVIIAWMTLAGHGVFLHAGRSGAVIIDVDNVPGLAECPALVAVIEAHIKAGHPVQSTGPGRAHYVFTQPPGRSLGNSKGKLTGPWGEVRGRNGVILAAPTPHPEGREYRWLATGPVPELPAEVAALLPDAAEATDAATDAEVAAFLAVHTAHWQPHRLELTVADLEKRLAAGESRHETALVKTTLALKESVRGMFSAADAVRRIGEVFTAAARREMTNRRTRTKAEAASEYAGIVAWAVAQVSDSVSDKITGSAAVTSVSDTSDTSDSTDDGQLLAGVRDGAWLTAQQFPPLRYAIPGLIPEGFTLLIGAPKIGKSWMVLDLLLAIAAGSRALGRLAAGDPRPVLYLAMEDSDRRMQDRCRQLLREAAIPPAFSYQTRIVPGRVLPTIAAWMRRNTGTALVVVDTLGKVMPPAMMGESHYQRDYRIGSAIKALADANPGLAIVVNHHDRKASAEDFIDSVSGTHGLAGAADTVAVLARKRQSDEGVLKVTGRDVPEDEYALTITDGMAWQLAGSTLASAAGEAARRSAAMSMSGTSADVLEFINSHPEGIRAKDVAGKFGKDAYQYLGRLVDMGHIEKLGRGFYIPVSEPSEPSESQVSDPAVSDSVSDTVRNEDERDAVALLEDKLGGQVLAWPEDSYGAEANQ